MYITIDTGRMVTSLVREFLQFFDVEYTLAVFDPEIGLVRIALLIPMVYAYIYLLLATECRNIRIYFIFRVNIMKVEQTWPVNTISSNQM